MVGTDEGDRQRVAIVTGGGGGIGAAIAMELGRRGTYVVTMDPLVSVDGSEQLPDPHETTAGQIVAGGGSARASSASVTDADGVRALFTEIADEFGGLDVVVNVAGITRPTSFARGSDDDWRSVLSVHLDGYRNVLAAALPIMAAAGRGHVLGVTSGSGWRPADTGAYGCAKRAVASLTWQMGRHAPPGVIVNAISPIAMTRMVTAALGRRTPPSASTAVSSTTASSTNRSSTTGGLSLASMPTPEQLGPLAAHLVGDGFEVCRGQVLFTAGSEMAVIDAPRLLEVVSTDTSTPLADVLESVTEGAFLSAERRQASSGGANPRFVAAFETTDADGDEARSSEIGTCVVVSDRPDLAEAVIGALESRGVTCSRVESTTPDAAPAALQGPALLLQDAADGPVDGVVVALSGAVRSGDGPSAGVITTTEAGAWEQVLADHAHIVDQIHADAAWARAVADLASREGRPIRLVTVTDAVTAGGQSRSQASAQLARAALGATDDRVAAFSIGVESSTPDSLRSAGELVAHLLCGAQTPPLSGAEFVVGAGTIGLRSHPSVGGSVVMGGTDVPDWFDDVLEGIVR